ncbi:Uncharacterised protein [uncultured archaeon]|nr:Uncharacterised protein [uncultured archaeon]
MSHRITFFESWIMESPLHVTSLGPMDAFDVVLTNIQYRLNLGWKSISLGDRYFKIVGDSLVYYFRVNEKNRIIIAVELEKFPQNLTIRWLGKNPAYKGKPPYASDLYAKILSDGKIIRVSSDDQLTEEGFKVWEKLFDKGYVIGVYQKGSLSGYPLEKITSKEDMKKYFGKSPKEFFRKYQFVISTQKNFAECFCYFNMQRLYETAGYDLTH